MGRPEPKVKSFDISKRLVFEAWEKVRDNAGAPGVDAVSVSQFQERERDSLYKLWNRMSAGSYMPGSGAGGGDTKGSWGRGPGSRSAHGSGIVPALPVIFRLL